MNKKRYEIHLQGKVQGVGFRYSAKEKADELGLCGYARNLHDGSVVIEIEGSESKSQEFLAWCKEGPYHADVEYLDFQEKEIEGHRTFNVY